MVDPRQEQWQNEKLEWVFCLPAGSLESAPWQGWQHWYEGFPEHGAIYFNSDHEYRTIIYNRGTLPEYLDGYKLVHTFPSEGTVECPGGWMGDGTVKESDSVVAPKYPGTYQVCPFCEQTVGSRHGSIYIGKDWEEAVYRKGVI
jgi:hypothetical protein